MADKNEQGTGADDAQKGAEAAERNGKAAVGEHAGEAGGDPGAKAKSSADEARDREIDDLKQECLEKSVETGTGILYFSSIPIDHQEWTAETLAKTKEAVSKRIGLYVDAEYERHGYI